MSQVDFMDAVSSNQLLRLGRMTVAEVIKIRQNLPDCARRLAARALLGEAEGDKLSDESDIRKFLISSLV